MSRDFMKRGGIDRLFLLYARLRTVRCGGANGSDFWTKSCHAGAACKQAGIKRKPRRMPRFSFCLLLYIQRKRRIFGGRVRQHAEHQLAVIAEMRDQHLRVPQREPPDRRSAGRTARPDCGHSRQESRTPWSAHRAAARACTAFLRPKAVLSFSFPPKLNYCKSYSVISSKLS